MAARRGLSEGDRALWRDYAARAAIIPLAGKSLPALPPAMPARGPQPPPRPLVPAATPIARPVDELSIVAAPAGLDAKRWTALRRGRLKPERTLDLHGRRAADAHGAVERFLAGALADGLRCVAIVTGKGPAPEGGVLRRELPHWLNAPGLRPYLLGAAHPHTSNQGAVHLLLRRRRP